MSRQHSSSSSSSNQQGYRTESVATTHVNLYKVLGLTSTCSNADIDRQYSQLVKQYHPDKVRLRHTMMITEMSRKTPITDAKRAELDDHLLRKVDEAKEMFNLINTAYQRLSNDRAGYDAEHNQFSANAEDDFSSMRGGAKAFMDAQGTVATDRDQANFRAQWLEMNRRHNFDQDTMGVALKEQDTNDRLRELKRQREQMELETRPERVFDPKNNLDQFNAVFERNYGQRGSGGEIQPFDSSDIGSLGGGETGGMFGEIGKVDNLYTDEAGGAFAPVLTGAGVNITRQDLANVTTTGSTFNHNVKTQSDRDEMKRRMDEYRSFGDQVKNMSISDYSTEVQYGGVVAGLESAQPQRLERLEFAANPQQVERYRDLLASHQRVQERQRQMQPQVDPRSRPVPPQMQPRGADPRSRPLQSQYPVQQSVSSMPMNQSQYAVQSPVVPQQPMRSNLAIPHPAVAIQPQSIQDRPLPTRRG